MLPVCGIIYNFLSCLVGSVQDVWAELRLLLISDQFLADYQVLTVNGNSLAPKRGPALNRDEELDYKAPPHKVGAQQFKGTRRYNQFPRQAFCTCRGIWPPVEAVFL